MTLRKCIKKLVEALGRNTASALHRLPLRLQAAIKHNLNPKGTLDYHRSQIRMYVDSQEQVSRLRSCKKEPETVRWIEAFSRPGDVFYDVGANVGAYSLIALAFMGGHGEVIALEPSFLNYTQLNANVILNGAEGQILPICVALSDRNTVARFEFSELVAGAANHVLIGRGESPEVAPARTWGRVITYRLDDLARVLGLPMPHLMKIDVDGGEFGVLQGAEQMLEQEQLRSIMMEVHLASSAAPTLAIDFLVNRKHFRIVERYQRQTENVFNYLFVRRNLANLPSLH